MTDNIVSLIQYRFFSI